MRVTPHHQQIIVPLVDLSSERLVFLGGPETYLGAGGLLPCIVGTAFVFFAIGAIKSRWSLTTWWCSGSGTFIIGMSAAALAFGVGFGFRMLFNAPAG
jgi:hypothetical protein